MSNLILGKFALEHPYYSTLPCSSMCIIRSPLRFGPWFLELYGCGHILVSHFSMAMDINRLTFVYTETRNCLFNISISFSKAVIRVLKGNKRRSTSSCEYLTGMCCRQLASQAST